MIQIPKFFGRSHDFIALNICVISECPTIIWFWTSHSDTRQTGRRTDGRTDIRRTIVLKSIVLLNNVEDQGNTWLNNIISRGDYIAVYYDSKFFVGILLNFLKIFEKSKSKKIYSHDYVDMEENSADNVFVLLNSLYQLKNSELKEIESCSNNAYFNKNTYICHIKNLSLSLRQLRMEVTKHYMELIKKQ